MSASSEKRGCLPRLFYLLGIDKSPTYRAEYFPSELPQSNSRSSNVQPFPYRIRNEFLSPAELSMFHMLQQIVGNQGVVLSKIRLADIFSVSNQAENSGAFNRIAQKHVDFLICHPQTMKPLSAVELDDRSHNGSKRQERDQFVNALFATVQLPLVRIPVQRTYNLDELSKQIKPSLPGVTNGAATITASQAANPTCPKCGTTMVLRTAKQGVNKGRQFYACPNYPQCREIVNIGSIG